METGGNKLAIGQAFRVERVRRGDKGVGAVDEALAEGGLGEEALDEERDFLRVVEEEAGVQVGDDGAVAGDAAGDDGHAEVHGLQEDVAEALAVGRVDDRCEIAHRRVQQPGGHRLVVEQPRRGRNTAEEPLAEGGVQSGADDQQEEAEGRRRNASAPSLDGIRQQQWVFDWTQTSG